MNQKVKSAPTTFLLNVPPMLAAHYEFPLGPTITIECFECGLNWPVALVDGLIPSIQTWPVLCACLEKYFETVRLKLAE